MLGKRVVPFEGSQSTERTVLLKVGIEDACQSKSRFRRI